MAKIKTTPPTMRKVSLSEFAEKINTQLTRRGHKMCVSYLYRLIREDIAETNTRDLWFEYVMEGEKDRIFVLVPEEKVTA